MSDTMTVYVLDGDSKNLFSAKTDLESAGFVTQVYTTIESLTGALPEAPTGLVLSALRVGELPHPDLREKTGGMPVVLWTTGVDVFGAVQAMRAGFAGVVDRAAGLEILAALLRDVLAGEPASAARRAAQRKTRGQLASLTPREREVLAELAHGKSNRATGAALDISPRTVEVHRGRIMVKLGAESMTGLVRNLVALDLHNELPPCKA
jgi:two-component system response regulator FixJ